MERRTFIRNASIAVASLSALGIAGKFYSNTADVAGKTLTIYSGRKEKLVGPLIEKIKLETGLNIQVRYGGTAELASTILEEGANSPAHIFFAQDAGALGSLSKEGRLIELSPDLLEPVDPIFRSPKDEWVGITGRARTVDYNVNLVKPEELPDSIWGFTDPKWGGGKIGWAPTNGSFQSFVTALRVLEGDDRAREWLEAIQANDPQVYPKNTPIVEALGREEIHVGFVNNYYLMRFKSDDPDFPVEHHYTKNDAGSIVNIAGVGILDSVEEREVAEIFIKSLLSMQSQQYFASETFEYPLIDGVEVEGGQKPLSSINTPDIDLSDLDDLKGTLDLLNEVGVL
ncbi:iron ABC transporter substrate-binding protein [Methanococcoides orientis]|uniref:iron ABC transporter substrate-binding protein n=1 Tax=Methanococcoides orientis TaxID=2822137 RepID=UPI001E53AF0B|nr:iron ABC transporter substrate-binding protein [Methanococcoides orientis]UGV41719.1 iron ABC transporter substrate-binding protein [Methanococcoides orientis]